MASTDSKELGVEMHAIDTEQDDNPDMTGAHVPVHSMGTAYDQRDMRVMGKLQELRVRDVFS
jgi:choline transport protein